MTDKTQFDYLLNAFEQASQSEKPADLDYAGKRKALYAYVRGLEGKAQQAAKPAVPEVLFDGYAVLQAMSEKARSRTSPENVSDVLDAAVKLIRADPTPPETAKEPK